MRTPPPVIATGQVAPQTFTLEGGLSASLTLAIGLVVAIEGAVIHLWVASRSQAWAWAIAAVNVATLLWLWRDHKAASSARLLVTDVGAEILIGNRIRCFAPRETIASAEIATWRSVPDMAADYLNTAKPLEPNVLLVLREPVTATLSLGTRKSVTRIGIRVPDPETAVKALLGGATAAR